MDFNVTEHKKFSDIVSDSALQLTFNKLSFVKFWYCVKDEYRFPLLSKVEHSYETFVSGHVVK